MRKRSWSLAVAMLALVARAEAQTTTGTIQGDVTDAEGAALPGVTITVTGDRGVERVVATGAKGSYLVGAVPPGEYAVEAALAGMARQRAEGVRVTIGGYTTIDFALRTEVEEEITVTAEAPLIDLRSSEAPTSFAAEFIEDLPTRRSFWDLVAVAPGISGGTEFTNQQSAYGGGTSSNSWNVDGLNVTGPETGRAWWYINPETIGEIQVVGIGASAEFGNMTGAAINVVTKSGGNDFAGAFNTFLQFDELTDQSVELDGFGYHRDLYHNETLTLGGPLARDHAWFFGALEYYDDRESLPGVDPAFPTQYYWTRYDLKLDWAISERSRFDAKGHYEDYQYDDASSPFIEPSANGSEFGTNPAWGVGLVQNFASTLFEAHYAGWTGNDKYHSQTGSTADAFADYSPPGGGSTLYYGGLIGHYDYDLEMHQADVKMSRYTDDFLGGDHDFRFGIQYSYGSADTLRKASSGGDFYYHYTYTYEYYGYTYSNDYFYKYTYRPFHYGAEQRTTSAFVQDSWQVNDRFTLNLGVRYDHVEGWIPDYDLLDADGRPTGERIPGLDDVVDWKHFSPRLGFAWSATGDGRTVVRGSAGIYYEGNVSGNWNFPPPRSPSFDLYLCEGPYPSPCEELDDSAVLAEVGVDPDLEAPRAVQYALGAERQLNDTMAVGLQLVYKETENLVGWEILGDGDYEIVQWTDPSTGRTFDIVSVCAGCEPTLRKGNRPGAGSLAPRNEYYNEYQAAMLTFERRQRDGWSLMASYTWSRSEGINARPTAQTQGGPLFGTLDGTDPNEWINSYQLLQNDREHMVRLQGTVEMPWDLELTGSVNWQSGRPFNRQARPPRALIEQSRPWVIVDPNSSGRRLPSTTMVDVGFGKRWRIGGDVTLKTDLQVLNLLNDDSHQYWETQRLDLGDPYVKDDYLYPRRAMLRIGIEF
jgi:outer membrane receptor protein involved in Fe transport